MVGHNLGLLLDLKVNAPPLLQKVVKHSQKGLTFLLQKKSHAKKRLKDEGSFILT